MGPSQELDIRETGASLSPPPPLTGWTRRMTWLWRGETEEMGEMISALAKPCSNGEERPCLMEKKGSGWGAIFLLWTDYP